MNSIAHANDPTEEPPAKRPRVEANAVSNCPAEIHKEEHEAAITCLKEELNKEHEAEMARLKKEHQVQITNLKEGVPDKEFFLKALKSNLVAETYHTAILPIVNLLGKRFLRITPFGRSCPKRFAPCSLLFGSCFKKTKAV